MEIHAHINSWARGHVDPWWSLENLALPYVNEPFNDQVALNEWTKLGYTQTKFTGDMYDMRSPEPVWINPFRKVFPLSNFSWSIYRMGPGTVLPEHTDTYSRFKNVYRIK